MLVLDFRKQHWLCSDTEWAEFLQLATIGGWDGGGRWTPAPTHFSEAESKALSDALDAVLPDIPNEEVYQGKAFPTRNVLGRVERLIPFPGSRLSALEAMAGPRKQRVVELIQVIEEWGSFEVRELGQPRSG